jgi:UDP-N-acetylmuramate--alanine ligase
MIAPLHRHMHFVGIGGSGMSGIARLYLETGDRVSGSDLRRTASLIDLARRGARIHEGHAAANLAEDVDLVVRSAAVRDENPEVRAALKRGIPVMKYAEALGSLMAGRHGVAVAGTHGKTTTTGMTAVTLLRSGLDPMCLVGGKVEGLDGGARPGAGPFVVEACEFDRSFLHLRPEAAAILNIDDDHLDCYGTMSKVEQAFRDFAANVVPGGLLLVHESAADIVERRGVVARMETFGTRPNADWRAVNLHRRRGVTSFEVVRGGKPYGTFRISPVGRHNVHNALVPIAVAHDLGICPEDTADALACFRGVERRLQVRVRQPAITIYDDFAHHPTEVAAALRALRANHPGARLTAVFQPHQYARTRLLLERFAEALLEADRVVVADIYRARDREEDVRAVSAADLAAAVRALGGEAVHVGDFGVIADRLEREMRTGDVAVTMGAGNIDEVADEMARRLGG